MLIFLVILARMIKLAHIHPQTELMHSLWSIAGRVSLPLPSSLVLPKEPVYMFIAAALTCEPSYHNFMIPVRL